MVRVLCTESADQACDIAARMLGERIAVAGPLRLMLPTGRTPLAVYHRLRAQSDLDMSAVTLLQMDEYAGLTATDPRSYRHYLRDQLPFGFAARHELDATAADLHAECARYQAVLDDGGIDVALLGLGRNGHVAFNEPGSDRDCRCRVVKLAASTLDDARSDFPDSHPPRAALTVGLRSLRRAEEIIVLATGPAKRRALAAMLDEAPHTRCPASWLADHPRLTVICDHAARPPR